MSTKSFNSSKFLISEYESVTSTENLAAQSSSTFEEDTQNSFQSQEALRDAEAEFSGFAPRQESFVPVVETTHKEAKNDLSRAQRESRRVQQDGKSTRSTLHDGSRSSGSAKVLKKDKLNTEWLLKHGHSFSYFGLFLFTAFLYFRPYELFPSLASLSSIAYWSAFVTALIYFPTQLGLEGNLTARPREVNLLLLFMVTVLLSMPLAADKGAAWSAFSEQFIKVILMFIVMVNVIRTERRLKALIWLSFAVSCYLSYRGILDYRALKFTTYGDRIWGAIGNLFGNPNDMAIHLVTMIPLIIALLFATRNVFSKLLYGACAVLVTAGLVVTYSRGGFLALVGSAAVFGWKAGKRNRALVTIGGILALVAFVALAPGEFAGRLTSIFDKSLDTGSVDARSALFWKSLHVAIANPAFGIGFENFSIVGIKNQVSHNAYTQVAAELGFTAFVIYCLFIITPFKRLLRIERNVELTKETRTLYYLAIGLQSSLVAYAISSFFGSVAYHWYLYYLVAYALCLDRLYAAHTLNAAAQNPLVGDLKHRHSESLITNCVSHQREGNLRGVMSEA